MSVPAKGDVGWWWGQSDPSDSHWGRNEAEDWVQSPTANCLNNQAQAIKLGLKIWNNKANEASGLQRVWYLIFRSHTIKPSHLFLTFKALCDLASVYLSNHINTTPPYSLNPCLVACFLAFCLLNPEIFSLPWGFILNSPLAWHFQPWSKQASLSYYSEFSSETPSWTTQTGVEIHYQSRLFWIPYQHLAHFMCIYLFIVWLCPLEC